jgi:hypothetical protein
MARFRGRCALNPAPGVGSIRSDSSAIRFSGSLLDDSGDDCFEECRCCRWHRCVLDCVLEFLSPHFVMQAVCEFAHREFQAQTFTTVPNAFERFPEQCRTI